MLEIPERLKQHRIYKGARRRVTNVLKRVLDRVENGTGAAATAQGERSSIDFWGKKVDVTSNAATDPTQLAFQQLNDAYRAMLAAGTVATADRHVQQDEHYKLVLERFRSSDVPMEDFAVKRKGFDGYLKKTENIYRTSNNYLEGQGGMSGYFPQKAFEHWISAEYLKWDKTDKVLDFAAWVSPAVKTLAVHRPADFYQHDIMLETNLAEKKLSGFSDTIEAPDNYFDYIMAHCAIDNFEGPYDTKFFAEANRILKPGGRILITPLHMASRFENRIAAGEKSLVPDPGAVIVLGPPGSLRFGRLYGPDALFERVIKAGSGLEFSLVHVTGLPLDVYPSTCTNRFMLVGKKVA